MAASDHPATLRLSLLVPDVSGPGHRSCHPLSLRSRPDHCRPK